jgi:hypothetical protein
MQKRHMDVGVVELRLCTIGQGSQEIIRPLLKSMNFSSAEKSPTNAANGAEGKTIVSGCCCKRDTAQDSVTLNNYWQMGRVRYEALNPFPAASRELPAKATI